VGIIWLMQNPDLIRRWVSEAEAEVAQLSDEVEIAGRRLTDARRRLSLLHEALAAVSSDPSVLKRPSDSLSVRDRVIRDTRAILTDVGRPMPIGAIHGEFIRRSYALPGRGSPTNLVAHLGVTDQIARHARGVYALPEWDAGDDGEAAGIQKGTKAT
jgi:hypothetical protein